MEPTPPDAETAAPPAALARAASLTREHFGFDELRPHQTQVLSHVLAGQDTLAVLPTGSGKSLCYALPALVRDGLVLVVSPLIALIRDQTRKFTAHGLKCASLDSLQSPAEKDRVRELVQRGELQLLIVSPERLARQDFRERLKQLPIQLVAVDEAHCISHWGSHFRPDYRLLGEYLDDFGPVQKLAVTATATQRVRDDIVRSLKLRSPATVWADFARENLNLKIVKADKVAEQLSAVLHAVLACDGSGIVYAPTRKNVRDIHRMLSDAGVKTTLYHAGLSPDQRNESQRAFMDGEARVCVATHAFGLGIDKADIRFVHHAGLPGSLEQYVQEIGRAGRDGQPAQCWLIYGPRDYYIQKFMIDKSYPPVELLADALAAAREYLQGSPAESETSLLRHLREALPDANPDTVAEAVSVLCREGLLARLRMLGQGLGGEVMIGEGPENEVEVLKEYPLRKLDNMAKLDAMKAYVGLDGGRLGFLDDYFRK